jgi:tellurite resistance protein
VDIEERGKVVELIQAVIGADGVVNGDEREFLRRVVERFGLTPEEQADRPVPSDTGRAMKTLRALTPDVQARVMALLVEAAVVDGRVEPEERALLLASAATLGIEAYALEERIARRLKSNVPGI